MYPARPSSNYAGDCTQSCDTHLRVSPGDTGQIPYPGGPRGLLRVGVISPKGGAAWSRPVQAPRGQSFRSLQDPFLGMQKQQPGCHPTLVSSLPWCSPHSSHWAMPRYRVGLGGMQTLQAPKVTGCLSPTPNRWESPCLPGRGSSWVRVTMGLLVLNQNVLKNGDGWSQGSKRGKGLTEDVWIPTYTHLNFHPHQAQGPV